jgi:hypothetical protein
MKSTVAIALSIAALAGVGVTAATAGNDAGGNAAPAVTSPAREPATAMDTEPPATDSDAAHAHVHARDYAAAWAAATPEERAGATALVESVEAGTAKYADSTVAAADGYGPNPNGGPAASHWPSRAAARDGRILDPSRPESLMYWTAPDGNKMLVGAVFKVFPRQPAAPTPGGDLTMWHVHEAPGTKCYPAEDETCQGMQMLHVFFFDGVVDPFTESWAAAAGGRDAFLRAMRAMA